jgi:dienelactone hydrolase
MTPLRPSAQFALAAVLALLAPAVAVAQTRPAHPRYVLAELNRDGIPPLLKDVKTKEQWAGKREAIRRVWLDYIGGLPPRAATKFEVVSETPEHDHVRQKIVYDTVYGDRVTAYLLIPNSVRDGKTKAPAVLALHGTGELGKDSVASPKGKANRMYGMELASRGYVVLAPDALTSGERIYPGLKYFRDAPFYEKHPNWTTVAKNITDHMQGVDLLAAHESVDPQRIGAIGHSFGAYNGYFLAGADQRVKAVVASCGFIPFTGSKTPGHWGVRDWYTHLPRITPDLEKGCVPFEFHEIAALAAPTPMFFYNGQSDAGVPHWKVVGDCMVDLRNLYKWMGAEERFVSVLGAGGHDFPEPIRKMSYDFLDRWLKDATPLP